MTKKELRILMLKKRSEMNIDLLFKQSASIVDQIRQDEDYIKAKRVALFYPMQTEVNLLSLLEDQDKEFCFPKVCGSHLHFYPCDKDQSFIKSSFGVMEPQGGKICDDHIDYMLAPALAISIDLYRIGYGKGFYDGFLKTHRPKKVMGVIYDFQLLNEIPHDEYDEVLDGYIKGNV